MDSMTTISLLENETSNHFCFVSAIGSPEFDKYLVEHFDSSH